MQMYSEARLVSGVLRELYALEMRCEMTHRVMQRDMATWDESKTDSWSRELEVTVLVGPVVEARKRVALVGGSHV